MSPSPAAPSTASVSACAITSPSEWPASPRGCSIATPPSTSGTPSSNACASTPRPIRSSDTERPGQLGERADRGSRPAAARAGVPTGRGARGRRPCRPRAPARRRCRRGRRRTRSRSAGDAALGDDPLEERGRRLLDAPARRRADEVDVVARAGPRPRRACCPTAPTRRPALAERRRGTAARRGRSPPRSQVAAGCSTPSSSQARRWCSPRAASPPSDAHQREARHAGRVGGALPQARSRRRASRRRRRRPPSQPRRDELQVGAASSPSAAAGRPRPT